MKQELISYGQGQGLDAKELEDKYQEYFVYGASLGQNPEEQERYADRMTKRYIKKELMIPRENVNAIVLGDILTDWGAIHRRIHKSDVFPADHKRAGQKIPEHDYNRTVLFFNKDKGELSTLIFRVEEYPLSNGYEYKLSRLKRGMKEKTYLWDDKIQVSPVGSVDARSLVVNSLKHLIVPKLSLLEATEQKLFLVNAQTIVNINDLWGDFQITIDDDSLSLEAKRVNVKFTEDKVNFSDAAQNVVMLVELIKKGTESIELQGYAAYPKKEDLVVKTAPIEQE